MAKTRNVMPQKGRKLREELYHGGRVPSFMEKVKVYKEIHINVTGIAWYDLKTHLNWTYGREKALGITKDHAGHSQPEVEQAQDTQVRVIYEAIAIKMAPLPDPPLSVLAAWAAQLQVPYPLVCEIAATIAGF
ncbi:hypothetical protein L226DRAFT_608064 [Lentinus tigrinus ALCF2SS1-7]|uniref:Uncharacterized protein n=1 Tax=Lentinus tigrinus ALCF2SS1-6 TaxID=1328759 RepID=A0A5C2STQ1_9APHY|nr:hypothetical protein L227DRAFT_605217 [Lentinus tigrinus ALCF2SS1-6]RPD80711.1 hypothetical protein L226DRAFT_608064 [Lentinus tigrinus ALCF2SS1-7]